MTAALRGPPATTDAPLATYRLLAETRTKGRELARRLATSPLLRCRDTSPREAAAPWYVRLPRSLVHPLLQPPGRARSQGGAPHSAVRRRVVHRVQWRKNRPHCRRRCAGRQHGRPPPSSLRFGLTGDIYIDLDGQTHRGRRCSMDGSSRACELRWSDGSVWLQGDPAACTTPLSRQDRMLRAIKRYYATHRPPMLERWSALTAKYCGREDAWRRQLALK